MRDFLLRVWLGDKLHAGIKPPVMNDRVSGVAGREQDGQIGAQGGRLLREHSPVHALREDDIGEQDVDPCALSKQRQRLHAVAGGEDRIAKLFKQSDGRIAHVVVILDDQDDLACPGLRYLRVFLAPGRRSGFDPHRALPAWQVDFDCSPMADFAVDPHVTLRLLDEAMDHRQSKTGAG